MDPLGALGASGKSGIDQDSKKNTFPVFLLQLFLE